jgi:phage-related protein
MSSGKLKPKYRVIPLRVVRRDAKKLLTPQQLVQGIGLAKLLQYYPEVPELSMASCGDGIELRLESPAINPQGWLRAIFWVHEKSQTIYIVDLFWKKTNKVTTEDLHRANHRIRQLKAQLR